MRHLLIAIVAILMTLTARAQAPQKFSFQAIIRNTSNEIVKNQEVGMQISILQTTVSGTAVFVELHKPVTNTNGLISVEIGSGEAVYGIFGNIDWSSGPFFIKTETDPSGGTNYTIEGVSQLLSVPYALHASTTDSVAGGITSKETDPLFGVSLASEITESDTVNWNNHTIDTKLNSEDIEEFGFVKGSHTDSTTVASFGYVGGPHNDSTSIANMGFITNSSNPRYAIGDFAQGGIVFWLDETGQHGLVCAKSDQNSGVRWYAGTSGNTQAKGDGPFAGEVNTSIIIAAQIAIGDDGDTYAARICNELKITEGEKTYGDWYLPSMQELNIMFTNQVVIDATAEENGGDPFASDFYWSSTELNSGAARAQQFTTGFQIGFNKNVPRNVRAIRAF